MLSHVPTLRFHLDGELYNLHFFRSRPGGQVCSPTHSSTCMFWPVRATISYVHELAHLSRDELQRIAHLHMFCRLEL